MTLWGQALQISNHSACDLSSICQCVVSVPHKINPTYFFHCNASCFVVTLYSQRTVKRLKVWSECSIHCNKWVIVTNRGRPISQLARGLICTFHSYSLQQSNNKSWVRKEPRLGLPFAVPRIKVLSILDSAGVMSRLLERCTVKLSLTSFCCTLSYRLVFIQRPRSMWSLMCFVSSALHTQMFLLTWKSLGLPEVLNSSWW